MRPLVLDPNEIRWWTFASGHINATLRYAFETVGRDWGVTSDNFLLRLRGEDLDEESFRDAIERLSDVEFWENDKLWAGIAESLPNYRLSKFQPLMPPWIEHEVIASYLLDVAGARQWIASFPPGDLV